MQHLPLSFRSDGLTLAGTLTLPPGEAPLLAPLPCVVMVHGSGPQDRDGNIRGFRTDSLEEDLIKNAEVFNRDLQGLKGFRG